MADGLVSRSRRLAAAAGRVLLSVVSALAAALVLAWLADRWPIVSLLVGVAGGLLLLRTAMRILRRPSPRAFAMVGLSLLIGAVLGTVTGVVLGRGSSATAPSDATGADLASSDADGSTAPGLALDALPDRDDDCLGCPGGSALTGLLLAVDDDDLTVTVGTARRPAVGDTLWLWFDGAAVHPLRLQRTAAGWQATVTTALGVSIADLRVEEPDHGGVAVTIRGGAALGPVAVVSAAGDRAPDVGVATMESGATVVQMPDGGTATEIAEAVAKVQAAFGHLEPVQQEFARAVLSRQLTTGTSSYQLRLDDLAGQQLTAEVLVSFPRLAQHITGPDGTRLQSLFVLADEITSCAYGDGGTARCEDVTDEVVLPVDGLVELVADPASVTVVRAPTRTVLGEGLVCFEVTATTSAGPPPGESCVTPEGVLAYNDNRRQGQRLELATFDPSVDEGAFTVPEGG